MVAGIADRIVFPAPIEQRIIEIDGDALLVALISKFLDNVTAERGCIYDVVV